MISNRATELLDINKVKTIVKENYIILSDDKFGGHEIALEFKEDGKLRNFKSLNVIDEAQASIILAFLSLYENIGPRDSANMKFREVESFLRDNNGEQSWEGVLGLRSWFIEFKDQFFMDLYAHSITGFKSSGNTWRQLNISKRLIHVSDFLGFCSDRFSHINAGCSLVAIEENDIFITFNDNAMEQGLKEYIGRTILSGLQINLVDTNIKLVAQ